MHQLAALAIDWGFSQDVADRAFAELLQSGPVPEQVTQALGDRFLELCMSIAHQVLPGVQRQQICHACRACCTAFSMHMQHAHDVLPIMQLERSQRMVLVLVAQCF